MVLRLEKQVIKVNVGLIQPCRAFVVISLVVNQLIAVTNTEGHLHSKRLLHILNTVVMITSFNNFLPPRVSFHANEALRHGSFVRVSVCPSVCYISDQCQNGLMCHQTYSAVGLVVATSRTIEFQTSFITRHLYVSDDFVTVLF